MAHRSENSRRLSLKQVKVKSVAELSCLNNDEATTYLFYLPFGRTQQDGKRSKEDFESLIQVFTGLNQQSTVCVLTTPEDAALLLSYVGTSLKFHHWVAVKTTADAYALQNNELPRRHAALLVFTRYTNGLRHAVTRIQYTHCPACGKTTKDYGGKTHMYHEYGTAISDVWRDVEWNPREGAGVVADRLRDMFGVEPYRDLTLIDLQDCLSLLPTQTIAATDRTELQTSTSVKAPPARIRSMLRHGDCLEVMSKIPDNSVDFCFADLPYNLKKKYWLSKDDLETVEYFEWCDRWLAELFRVLKPGGTLAILNIPLWSARHFEFLSSLMTFRGWIVWDALSRPSRKIMPAHYSILCFSKGKPNPLPGLSNQDAGEAANLSSQDERFCVRPRCVATLRSELNDRTCLTDVWHDVHRLKHNSRRVNHPCQLPPLLMRRLFSLFTAKGDVILDCFNGAATSTLVAAQMGRIYIGVEKSKRYHNLALKRHREMRRGVNPFGTGKQTPKTKNSRDKRLPGRKSYKVLKKELQLEVRRISEELGRLPTYDDVVERTHHPPQYFKEYFSSWGEACAAARATGMSVSPSV